MNDSDRGKGIYMISGTRQYDSMHFVTPGICQSAEILLDHLYSGSRAGDSIHDSIHGGSDFCGMLIYLCSTVQLKVIDTLGHIHTWFGLVQLKRTLVGLLC